MPIPQSLQDKLRKRQVVPFVGAGVSMSILDRLSRQPIFPSWRQLLSGAADRLEAEMKSGEAELVRAFLKIQRPDFLYAAQQARDALGAVWYEYLKQVLDIPHERIDDGSLELARSVWRLGSNLVITTNYDEVLRWACPQQGDLQTWDIEAPVQQAYLLRGEMDRPVIWHLHGRISNPSELILARDGYKLLYPEDGRIDRERQYQAALATLRQLAVAKSVLFVGFSLEDEHVGVELKSVHEIYEGAGQHFAIVQARDADRIRNLKMGIEPITFEDFGEPLLALLKELEAVAGSKTDSPKIQTQTSDRPVVIPDYSPHRSVFYVPFKQKGDEMVGQLQVLADVRKQLTEGKRTAIGQTAAFRGLGGLGKTQLAIEYAYRYRDEYPNGVIWLNADQDIDAQLIDIAEKARWLAPESDHKYKIQIAQQRIRSYSDCLIVFDNLEHRQAIEPYLPEPEANPHILVTSRTDHAGFQPVALDPLDGSLSRELLTKEAGREPGSLDEDNAIQGIVALLGGLPLALELAGAYLGHRPSVTFKQYFELLSKDLKSALPKRVESFTKHEADLYSTLRLSEGLLNEEPYLRDILDLLTWSGSAPMSTGLIAHLLNVTEASLLGSLAGGTELRLLQRSEKSNSYSLHRLVGEVRRVEIPLEERTHWVDTVCTRLGDWFQEKKEDFSQLTKFESEIDHLQRWQENADKFTPVQSSRLMWLQAYPSYHRGRYLEARSYVLEAQRIFDQVDNTNRELQANLVNDLATTSEVLGDFTAGLSNHLQALAMRRELFGDLHADVASSFQNLGHCYNEQGDLVRALEYSLQALNVRRTLFGETHPSVAASLSQVGSHYNQQGNTVKALEYSRQALAMRRELLGDLHPDIAISLNNIGSCYGDLRDIALALEYSGQALTMQRGLFGELHPDIATSLSNVGHWHGVAGDLESALTYSQQALAMRRELFSEVHPDIALSLTNVGGWHARRGETQSALKCFSEALPIYRDLFGERHAKTIEGTLNVAHALRVLNRREEALKLVSDCLKLASPRDPSLNDLKQLERQLLSNTFRKGFRPSSQDRKRKKRKKKRQ